MANDIAEAKSTDNIRESIEIGETRRVFPKRDTQPREEWIGRFRYILVPIVAVLAIATAIYVLDDVNNGGSSGRTESQPGSSNPISVTQAGNLSQIPAPRIGFPATDFTLSAPDGKQIKLSDYRGKTVFLNFFASWCPPCRAEMPDVLSTYEENRNSDVVVLAVSMQEEANVVGAYAASSGLTFPIALDRSGYVTSIYRVTAIPTSFFIDKEGIVRDVNIGAMSKKLMLERLQKAI